MSDMNQVSVVGRIVADATYNTTHTSGRTVANLTIASTEIRGSGEARTQSVNFFDCVLWGSLAEAVKSYMTKGRQVGVQGVLRQNRWTNAAGVNLSRVVIYVRNIQLLARPANEQVSVPQVQETADIGL